MRARADRQAPAGAAPRRADARFPDARAQPERLVQRRDPVPRALYRDAHRTSAFAHHVGIYLHAGRAELHRDADPPRAAAQAAHAQAQAHGRPRRAQRAPLGRKHPGTYRLRPRRRFRRERRGERRRFRRTRSLQAEALQPGRGQVGPTRARGGHRFGPARRRRGGEEEEEALLEEKRRASARHAERARRRRRRGLLAIRPPAFARSRPRERGNVTLRAGWS